MVSRFRNNQRSLGGMQQFIGSAIWHEDLNALDAVAKGIPASVTTRAVAPTDSLGPVSGSPDPGSVTVNGVEADSTADGDAETTPAPPSFTVAAVTAATSAAGINVTPASALMSFSGVEATAPADGPVTVQGLPATVSFVAVRAKAVAHVTDTDVEEATLGP